MDLINRKVYCVPEILPDYFIFYNKGFQRHKKKNYFPLLKVYCKRLEFYYALQIDQFHSTLLNMDLYCIYNNYSRKLEGRKKFQLLNLQAQKIKKAEI